MNDTFMKEKPVGPLLASMALPMVFSMLVNSLYNIVDSFFVAQISEQAMTALSLVYPVQNMINAVAIGFGIGINARVSYHLGAGDKKMADTAATHGFFLSVIHGILMTVISITVMPVFLQMYTQDETVIRMGLEYSTIVFLFSTVISISLFFEKLFQAVGRMKVSMIALLVGCTSNIILDPFLIWGIGFFPKLGIRGAALATGIGQVLTIAVYMFFLYPEAYSCTCNAQSPENKQSNGSEPVCHRCSRDPEPGTAIVSDLFSELRAGRLLGQLCGDPWHLLQTADLPVSPGQRNHPGNAPADRL